MGNKNFWMGVIGVWVLKSISDWAFHGIWLQGLYMETAQFWRPQAEMQGMMWAMWLGNFVFSWSFVWIFSQGISKDWPWGQAFRYGWAIVTVSQVPQWLGTWATTPYPAELLVKWAVIGFIQAMLCSFWTTWAFRPKWQAAVR